MTISFFPPLLLALVGVLPAEPVEDDVLPCPPQAASSIIRTRRIPQLANNCRTFIG
jgi:hypothetical protein